MDQNVFTAVETQKIEQFCIETLSITEYDLMLRAGKALINYINQVFPNKKVMQIICGSGNNGGDGYTVARLLLNDGKQVSCYEGKEPTQESAKKARNELIASGLNPQSFTALMIQKDALIIDALLGIGCDKPVQGIYLDIINQINESGESILAADIPSGLCADSGKPLGSCVKQAHVLSFVTKKLGTVIGDSVQIINKLTIDKLDIPEKIINQIRSAYHVMNKSALDPVIKKRANDAYKNQFGHILLVGGDSGYGGAIILAARAASQSGVGLVSVYTKKDHKEPLLTHCSDCMIHDEESDLKALIHKATAIVVGPGLGLGKWSEKCLKIIIESAKPIICDADAITLLARDAVFPKKDNLIITPHEGEAKRLIGEDHENRYAMVTALVKKTAATVILKGQNTLIKKEDDTFICTKGNPGLATAGTGDVLAGMIGGFLAQGHSTLIASKAGVYLHAICGDACSEAYSERSMTASDLVVMMKTIF
ncbi:hypothetical protein CL658_03700 [bacterium]|nr:hypothetical protein [bacterium]|tara:strand:- start:3239 stop:4684 length:1446 start_codon:yes stop_codon:yes gene_type:complete